MAIFSNRATLTYNGISTNSNVAFGEILDVLTAEKTAVNGAYGPGQQVTYAVTLRNTGTTALNALTLTDDLGGYTFGTGTVYPLTLDPDTVRLLVNGTLVATPTVNAGPPAVITGINIPAGGDAVLLYQTTANEFASPVDGAALTNTVTVTGGGLTTPITAAYTLPVVAGPNLSVSKSISPAQVVDNDRVTYTFLIQNTGNEAVDAADNATITDTLDPILTALAVTFNGAAWTPGTQYTYNEANGQFATTPGQILVPAATYTQDPATGAYTVTPGTATLTITGTI